MTSGVLANVGECGAKLRGRSASKNVGRCDVMSRENFLRDIKFSVRGMECNRAEQSGQAVCDAGMAGELVLRGPGFTEDPHRKLDHCRRSVYRVGLELIE